MRRRIFLAGFAMFCLVGASGAGADSDLFEGKIAAAGAKAITVVAKNGDNVEFMIPADCKITIDGQASTADKLAVGLSVRIQSAKGADGVVAKRIDALSAG